MTTVADAADTAAPLRIEGLGVRYPARREPSLSGVDLTVAAGSQVGVAGRTGAGKSTLALAAAGFIPRVVRAKLDGRVAIEGVDAATASGRRAARPGRDRLLDAGQPALGLEAVGPRGAGVRSREPGRAPGRDGRPDRRHAGPPVHRPPRRSRAVRPVGRRAAAGGDRQHRRDGHVRPGPRRADRPARPGGHGRGRRPPGGAGPGREQHPVRGARPERARPDGSLPRPRSRPAGAPRACPGRPWPRRRPVASLPAPTLVRLAQAAGIDLARAFDEAAIAAGLAARRAAGRTGDSPRRRAPPSRRDAAAPGRRRPAGHRSASRSRTSSIATRPGSRPSAASRSRSSRARPSRSWARTARARRRS